MKSFNLGMLIFSLFTVMACNRREAGRPIGPHAHTVVIENMRFSPSVIHARPGDTVIFQNVDLVPHTATERSRKIFDSGLINRNDTWKLTVAGRGTFDYRCMYHPDMTGTILVE